MAAVLLFSFLFTVKYCIYSEFSSSALVQSVWCLFIWSFGLSPFRRLYFFLVRRKSKQKDWHRIAFLIQTINAFPDAPVHTARPCAEWTYSKRPVCCCWKVFIVWKSSTVGMDVATLSNVFHNYLILLISRDGCSSFRCTSSSWRSLGGLLVAIDKRGDPIKLGFYCFFYVVLHSHIFSYCTQKWRRHMSLLSFKFVCLYTVQSCCSIFTVIIEICRLFPWC